MEENVMEWINQLEVLSKTKIKRHTQGKGCLNMAIDVTTI